MTRARRAALIVVLLGSASVLVAGDARGNREAVSPAQTVTSRDGGLTVSVPRGALSKPTRIRVRLLTRAQYPPGLRNAAARPGSKLYELEPSGLRFLKPVKVTRRIDTHVAGFEKDTVQGVVLASRDRRGKWELLRNLSVTVDVPTDTLSVSGTTRHFSTLLALDEGFSLGLLPRQVEAFVGDEWLARVVSKIDNRRRRDTISIDGDETRWSSSGAVGVGANLTYLQQKFVCIRAGTGTYRADVTVAESSIAVFLGSLGGRYEEKIPVSGRARCKAAPAPPPPAPRVDLTAACVAVTHTPFGSFPSFLRWLLGFERTALPANPRAELTVTGMNGGQPISAPIDAVTGTVELQGGISSFGPKQVQRLAVAGRDLTSQLVAKTAAAPVVTATQGVIVGTCP
jgi:hypothetical protein